MAKKSKNKLDKINGQSDFEYSFIIEHLKTVNNIHEKLKFLYYTQKEINNIIFILETNPLNDYDLGADESGDGVFNSQQNIDSIVNNLMQVLDSEQSEVLKQIMKEPINELKKLKGYLPIENTFPPPEYPKAVFNYGWFKELIKLKCRTLTITEKKIQNEIQYLEKIIKSEPSKNLNSQNLKIQGKQVDIVRIFEAMKTAGILSTKTEVKQIAQLFFNDPVEITKFVANFNAQKNRIKDADSKSNSENIPLFIESIAEGLKKDDLQKLITSLERILKEKIKFL